MIRDQLFPHLLTAYRLLPSAYCLLISSAYRSLLTAHCSDRNGRERPQFELAADLAIGLGYSHGLGKSGSLLIENRKIASLTPISDFDFEAGVSASIRVHPRLILFPRFSTSAAPRRT